MDNGPIARSQVFQQVLGYLGIELRTHLPAGTDGQRVTARAKGKVERPFRTVKEMHETLYHFHEPQTEAEANAWLMQFLLRYNGMQHRAEAHSRLEDWLQHLPPTGLRAMCDWECIFHGCLPPSPWEGCHAVHMKPATQSTGRLPPNPWESCHPVHVKPATWTTGRLPPTPGEICLSRSAATLGGLVLFHRCSFCQPRMPFPHGFALQGDLVGIMHEAVEDRIGQRRIPQGLMPVLDRQLTGH